MSRAVTVALVATIFLLQSCCAPRATAAPKTSGHCPIKKASECPATKRTCAPQPPQALVEPPPVPASTLKQVIISDIDAARTLPRGAPRAITTLDRFAARSLQLRI